MRLRISLLFLIAFAFITLRAQRSPEAVGKQIVEALVNKDFKILQAMSPDQDLLAKLMADNGEGNGQIQPETAHKMMQQKMRSDFNDMLKSAKFHKVKIQLLAFGHIESEEENPEAKVPMKVLQMITQCKNKQYRITYSVIQESDDWYFTGILQSMDVFQPIEN